MPRAKKETDPDFDLVQRSKAGDSAAFEELLSRHYQRTCALIFRLTGADHCEDVTQEAFLLAYRNINRFRGEAKFSTWLTRIAINLCRSQWRRRKKQRENSLADIPPGVLTEKADPNPETGFNALTDAEQGEKIDREIAALPPKLRLAFTLRYVEGYSYGEVAAILGCKEGTVRSRLFNARQILKVQLKDLVR